MEITGEISNIIYKNEINSYTIAEFFVPVVVSGRPPD